MGLQQRTLSKMRKQLADIDSRLSAIATEIRNTTETSSAYYSALTVKTKKIYEEMRNIFKKYFTQATTDQYYKELHDQIMNIKSMKFEKPRTINYTDVENASSHKQSLRAILDDGLNAFLISSEAGQKTLNRYMRLTQQINVSEKAVNKLVSEGFVEKGASYGAKKKLREKFEKQYEKDGFITVINKNGDPMNFNIQSYADMVARTKILEANNIAAVNSAMEFGSDLVQVSSHNTPTPICQEFEGKIFSISGNDPDFPPLEEVPPFHPNPFTKDTEIYTNSGWKFVSEIKKGEKCFSINKETFQPEFANVIDTIFRKAEKVIRFKNKICEIKVAHDHNMLYQTDWDSKHNQGRFHFIQAQDLLGKKSGRFYASSEFSGGIDIDPDYCYFLGVYLSDGSIDGNKICIAKTDRNMPDRIKVLENLKKLFPDRKLTIDKDCIRFTFPEMAARLKKLGKCSEKYIPSEIMNSSVKSIKAFLDGFVLCDGHTTPGKKWNHGNFQDTRIFFSTSKKMIEQIGELIVRIGKRPSFKTQRPTGKLLQFPNGLYASKLDIYYVTECHHKYISLQNMEIKEVKYNDFVYCVSLDKNFTLLTRTNGQVVWCGNCLHSLTVVFREVLERRGIDKYIEFSNGETEIHPTRQSHTPVSERGK